MVQSLFRVGEVLGCDGLKRCCLVDVDAKSTRQRAVPLQTCAFVVACQWGQLWLALGRLHLALGGHSLGGVAPSFLSKSSTATCHCDLGRTWCFLGTSVRRVALFCARMATHRLVLSTGLAARFGCVFAILRAMAVLPAEMGATLEKLPTYLTAARISQPAGNVFQHPLSTQTRLLGQERTLWAVLLVCVAGMRGLRVAASLWTLAGEVTSWWLCTTRLRRV